MIHHGDCLDVMARMEPESVDAVVTDPPYQISFMSKGWDRTADHRPWAEAAYRVAKPSAYLLAFGGTRTVHRMTVALEDAGWIIRDMLVWAYASGFPKSRASLKPAWEPIVLARKPGPLRELRIDMCRVPFADADDWQTAQTGPNTMAKRKGPSGNDGGHFTDDAYVWPGQEYRASPRGRWPANVILTDPIFDGGVEGVVGGGIARSSGEYEAVIRGERFGPASIPLDNGPQYADTGSYSRFFLIPKADRADREPVLGGLPEQVRSRANDTFADVRDPRMDRPTERKPRANQHPTVKPTELMQHLVRLVTPAGGTVLDPFAGSGSTLLAAEREGFAWIGIEKEAEYVAIAEARLNGTQRGLGLVS